MDPSQRGLTVGCVISEVKTTLATLMCLVSEIVSSALEDPPVARRHPKKCDELEAPEEQQWEVLERA